MVYQKRKFKNLMSTIATQPKEIRSLQIFINLFLNKLTKNGNKHTSFLSLYRFINLLKRTYNCSPYTVLEDVFSRGAIRFTLVEYTKGGKKHQVPSVADPLRERYYFIGDFIKNALARSEPTVELKLLGETQDFLANKGVSYKQKVQVYSIAKQNKMFSRNLYEAIAKGKKQKAKYNMQNVAEKKFSF